MEAKIQWICWYSLMSGGVCPPQHDQNHHHRPPVYCIKDPTRLSVGNTQYLFHLLTAINQTRNLSICGLLLCDGCGTRWPGDGEVNLAHVRYVVLECVQPQCIHAWNDPKRAFFSPVFLLFFCYALQISLLLKGIHDFISIQLRLSRLVGLSAVLLAQSVTETLQKKTFALC